MQLELFPKARRVKVNLSNRGHSASCLQEVNSLLGNLPEFTAGWMLLFLDSHVLVPDNHCEKLLGLQTPLLFRYGSFTHFQHASRTEEDENMQVKRTQVNYRTNETTDEERRGEGGLLFLPFSASSLSSFLSLSS